jgi:hypothetical protein
MGYKLDIDKLDKQYILDIISGLEDNVYINDRGCIDTGWVSLQKLKIETYFKLIGDEDNTKINIDLKI